MILRILPNRYLMIRVTRGPEIDESPAPPSETLWAEKLGLTVRQLRQWHALHDGQRMTVGEFKRREGIS